MNQNASKQDSSIAITNECPKKDKDGNCLVPGVYSDSDEIGGG